MKFSRGLLGLLLIVFLFLVQARFLEAQFYTGNQLVDLMRENDAAMADKPGTDYTKAYEYMAYICGVVDASHLLYTFPGELTKGQVSAIVSKYLKNHPERWSERASTLVISALTEAFPKK